MPDADRDATRRAFSKPAAFVVLNEGLTLKDISAARLRELLIYDPETGVFTRRVSSGRGRYKAGSKVGSKMPIGYIEIGVNGDRFLAHRLAILYVTGSWPKDHVDHINGQRADNRFSNLRQVDNRTNIENRNRPNKNNRSGWLGCHQEGRVWVAQIMVNRRVIVVGRHETPELAHAAYINAKRLLHKGCTL